MTSIRTPKSATVGGVTITDRGDDRLEVASALGGAMVTTRSEFLSLLQPRHRAAVEAELSITTTDEIKPVVMELPHGQDWLWYDDAKIVALSPALDPAGRERAMAELATKLEQDRNE